MWEESKESPKPLRTGLTTGACATACSVAAAEYLFSGETLGKVSIVLPKGQKVDFQLTGYELGQNIVRAQVIKDAGDDPDATHGATVFVELSLIAEPGILFKAAAGVGTVTREGLSLAVGEPAINPVPRKMIDEHLQKIAERYHYSGGFQVAVGIENGEAIAQKTMNPRLGIVGGLSILGTTGIVRPFSCAAWVASIYQGIDVAKANGIKHIAASTGNSSEEAIKKHYQLPDIALIEMGDFAGAVLKHLKKVPVAKLSICGGFGKITKLANGHLNLNSRKSAIDFKQMALLAKEQGANEIVQQEIMAANTSIEALNICQQHSINLAQSICDQALLKVREIVPQSVELEVWAIDRQGEFIASAVEV